MLGISALKSDINQKLEIFSEWECIEFIEYGADMLSDFKELEKHLGNHPESPQLAFHLPLKLNAFEDIEQLRKSNFNYIKSIIEEGLKFKPLYFNMHLGYAFSSRYKNSTEYFNDICTAYIRDLLEIDPAVDLYLENVYTSNKTGGCDLFALGTDENQLMPIFKKLPSDRVGFCYDLGHHMIQKHALKDPRLFENCMLHFNVNDEKQDLHLGLKAGTKFDSDFFEELIKSYDFKYAVLELPLGELKTTIGELQQSVLWNTKRIARESER